jgi:hypothetical protein
MCATGTNETDRAQDVRPACETTTHPIHGAVERANRTHTEEFYEVTDAEPDLVSLQVGLRAWETVRTYRTSTSG